MCNMVSSFDGAVEVDGLSGGLSGPGDKAVFSAIRAVADVIIVASGTVIAENYRKPQTPPAVQAERQARGQSALPRIAIVSGSLSIDTSHRVFDSEAPPIVITHAGSPEERRTALAEVSTVLITREAATGETGAGAASVDLHDALQQLGDRGANVALLEGGPTLNGAFADDDLIDEWCLSTAPILVGGNSGRILRSPSNSGPLPFRLHRTLHDDGFLFHRYLRDRAGGTIDE